MTYAERVARYEAEGLTTSDAQAAADADDLAAPDRSLRLTPHPFVEDEERSRFSERYVRWSSRCRTCGTVGYLTSSGWRHKPLSKSSKRLIELEEVQR